MPGSSAGLPEQDTTAIIEANSQARIEMLFVTEHLRAKRAPFRVPLSA